MSAYAENVGTQSLSLRQKPSEDESPIYLYVAGHMNLERGTLDFCSKLEGPVCGPLWGVFTLAEASGEAGGEGQHDETKIEITDEMVEAGIQAYLAWRESGSVL